MARRLNFTGRGRINQRDARIRIVERNGRYEFEADLKFDDDLDPAALVHVEAFRSVSTLWKRFDFGRVGNVGPREQCSLEEFGKPEGIRFRVKVASSGDSLGRLLAEADNIRPRLPGEIDEHQDPILNVAPGDLKDEVWKVEFGDGDMPVLLINQKLADWSILAGEPLFRSLVTSAAMRQVLSQILFHEGLGVEEDDTDWRTRWIRFAEDVLNVGECPGEYEEKSDGPSKQDIDEWIDDAVSAFCRQSNLLGQLIQCREAGAPT